MDTLIMNEKKPGNGCCDDTCCQPKEPATELKQIVKSRYADIAEGKTADCCEGSCCGGDEITSIADSYGEVKGYNADADLNLGCGLPTAFALIKKGDTVVDLGSGAGNDCFVARYETGETGKVIGVDFTEAMIERARRNVFKLGYNNVEFVQGDIENIPLPDGIADVVVSNCVFNLVPDKPKAFQETFRILKAGGHFSISDVVSTGDLPDSVKRDAALYVGCISGAIDRQAYLDMIASAGFTNIRLQKEKRIYIPEQISSRFLTGGQLEELMSGPSGLYSITVYAEKPVR